MPRRIVLGLLTAALLLPGACRDPGTEPIGPVAPSLRVDAPIEAQIVDDTLLQVRGIAESPGHVARVSLKYRTSRETTSPFVTELPLYYYKPWSDTARSRVEFDTTVYVPAGSQDIVVDMDYRLPDAPTVPNTMTRTVRVRVYRKPVLRIESGLADTLYQRSLSLIASMTAIDSAPKIELVIDEGTAAERRVSNRTAGTTQIFTPRPPRGDTTAWFIDLRDTLSNGPHRLVFRVYDEMGVADSVVYPFVTWVASLPYTMSLLPGLGGASSDARDINASGVVAGWALDAGGTSRAVTWTSGAVTTLPTRSGAGPSKAFALNDLGAVVGSVQDTLDGVYCERATRWTSTGAQLVGVGPDFCGQLAWDIAANGAMLIRRIVPFIVSPNVNAWLVEAGTQTGLPGVLPHEVNDRSQVVGSIHFPGLRDEPYALGVTVKMPSVRPANGHISGTLVGLNHTSQALGTYGALGIYTTFVSTVPGAAPVDLNPFLAAATPVQVTNNGTVLSFDEPSKTVFLWRAGRTMRVSFPAGGWTLDGVAAMNDAGDIVGHATETSTGRTAAVWLRPAP
jgi:hypothetical protein